MKRTQSGMTIVETLVVIAVIGALVALLIPAVLAAREAARKAECKSHLRELALACLAHEGVHKHFPTGGWGYAWVGDPDRGFGPHQPGGWIFNVLPYIEQQEVWSMSQSLRLTEKLEATTRMMQVPLEILSCPSRRSTGLTAYKQDDLLRNARVVPFVAKSDYAINAGDADYGGGPGADSFLEGDRGLYQWRDFSAASGISYLRSAVRVSQVLDGSSKTYLLGEKHVAQAGGDQGDDQSMYVGYDYDVCRWTQASSPPQRDAEEEAPYRFGSAHAAGCHLAFADGSVRIIAYDVAPEVHRSLGNRHDGLPFEDNY